MNRKRRRIAALCFLLAYPLNEMPPAWALRTPPVLQQPTLIAWDALGGLLDGCYYAVYRLDPQMVENIKRRGSAFFENEAPPLNGDERNHYSAWAQTPIPLEKTVYALTNAACNGPYYPFDVEAAARGDTSFYSLSRNREGMWFIDPAEGLVIYRYFG